MSSISLTQWVKLFFFVKKKRKKIPYTERVEWRILGDQFSFILCFAGIDEMESLWRRRKKDVLFFPLVFTQRRADGAGYERNLSRRNGRMGNKKQEYRWRCGSKHSSNVSQNAVIKTQKRRRGDCKYLFTIFFFSNIFLCKTFLYGPVKSNAATTLRIILLLHTYCNKCVDM